MRLINISSYHIEDFFCKDTPKYVTLSHTWVTGEELSYQEWTTALFNAKSMSHPGRLPASTDLERSMRSSLRQLNKMRGFDKIHYFMEEARNYGVKYCWADTVCIDKASSAELSEAINSMWRIYQQSEACIAYLGDVDGFDITESRWFTRGWTIQELIAPRTLFFYDKKWRRLGNKKDYSRDIDEATGIDQSVIEDGEVGEASVARRMSWVSHRTTTREEDMAYCLLGIFDINMPLLYGEGARAFTRLQEEIIKKSDDDSIFAWKSPTSSFFIYRSLLARSPDEFAGSREVLFTRSKHSEPFWMTNKGLRAQFSGQADPTCSTEFVATLECKTWVINPKTGRRKLRNVELRLCALSKSSSQYARVDCHKLVPPKRRDWPTLKSTRVVFVRSELQIPSDHQSLRIRGFRYGFRGRVIKKFWPPESLQRIMDSRSSNFLLFLPESLYSRQTSAAMTTPRDASVYFRVLSEENILFQTEIGLGRKRGNLLPQVSIFKVEDNYRDFSSHPDIHTYRSTHNSSAALFDDELWYVFEC